MSAGDHPLRPIRSMADEVLRTAIAAAVQAALLMAERVRAGRE